MKNKIAVFACGWSSEYIEYVVSGLQKKATLDSMDIFVFVTYPSYATDECYNDYVYNIFNLANPDDYDGAIFMTNTFNDISTLSDVHKRFLDANIPSISLEVDLPNISSIKSENYRGMYELATHLIKEHKAKRFIYVNGVFDNIENQTRREALFDALAMHRLELVDEFLGDFSFYSAYNAIEGWLRANRSLPDAFVCANDNLALGIISSLLKHGYKVPDDVIVTGFDNSRKSQYSFPNVATVSRGWEYFGDLAYDRLMYQIAHPDERFNDIYNSVFVPGESCGCTPPASVAESRLMENQMHYAQSSRSIRIDRLFRSLQLSISELTSKEDFSTVNRDVFNSIFKPGNDFCICTEPDFFEKDETKLNRSIHGYSSRMDVLYEMKNGKVLPFHSFNTKELYPGYLHEKGKSNIYIFTPFTYTDLTIGYLAIKNHPEELFNQSLGVLCMDIDTVLVIMQRFFSNERNRKRLEQIYMTDTLTGLYNRAGCEKILFDYINNQQANNKTTIMLFADIDNMKIINDQYGHLNGDLALKAVANAFIHCAPKNWLFSRYGGDEYIGVGNYSAYLYDDFEKYIAELSTNINNYLQSLNLSFELKVSIGYTLISSDSPKTIDEYIHEADDEMYKNKIKSKA